nr:hypothetical protein [Okeania sp. SIO2F4]
MKTFKIDRLVFLYDTSVVVHSNGKGSTGSVGRWGDGECRRN